MLSITKKIPLLILILTIIPVSLIGFIALNDSKSLGYDAIDVSKDFGAKTVNRSIDTVTEMIGNSFTLQANFIANRISDYLDAREQDLNLLSSYLIDSPYPKRTIDKFRKSRTGELWYNNGTDINPIEQRENASIYSGIIYIRGSEMFSSGKKDIEYLDIPKDRFYVSYLYTDYVDVSVARHNISGKAWNIVPGRDVEKRGYIIFSKPVIKQGHNIGVLVLLADYRFFQELTKHIDPAKSKRVVSTPYEGNYVLVFDDEGNTIIHPKPSNIRGYVNGSLMHTNTKKTPGGIFNLKDYDKTGSYKKIYNATILNKEPIVISAIDIRGRSKMTVSVPILYDKGGYNGTFGGVMLSINTDKFYVAANRTHSFINDEINSISKKINGSINSMTIKLIIIIVVMIILSLVVGFIFSKTITDPIKKLTKAGIKVAEGDINAPLPEINTEDEVRDLSDTMALLIGALKFHKSRTESMVDELMGEETYENQGSS